VTLPDGLAWPPETSAAVWNWFLVTFAAYALARRLGQGDAPPSMPVSTAFIPAMFDAMDRDAILATLRAHRPALEALGVLHAALFGSRARGDARPDSDTDIMVEIDPAAPVGVYEYVGIKEFIAGLFDGRVDVVDRDGLKPWVRPAATADAIYAF
jgi:predicted nucleotidyltransferase